MIMEVKVFLIANISKLGEKIRVGPTEEVTLKLITKGEKELTGKEEDDVSQAGKMEEIGIFKEVYKSEMAEA